MLATPRSRTAVRGGEGADDIHFYTGLRVLTQRNRDLTSELTSSLNQQNTKHGISRNVDTLNQQQQNISLYICRYLLCFTELSIDKKNPGWEGGPKYLVTKNWAHNFFGPNFFDRCLLGTISRTHKMQYGFFPILADKVQTWIRSTPAFFAVLPTNIVSEGDEQA